MMDDRGPGCIRVQYRDKTALHLDTVCVSFYLFGCKRELDNTIVYPSCILLLPFHIWLMAYQRMSGHWSDFGFCLFVQSHIFASKLFCGKIVAVHNVRARSCSTIKIAFQQLTAYFLPCLKSQFSNQNINCCVWEHHWGARAVSGTIPNCTLLNHIKEAIAHLEITLNRFNTWCSETPTGQLCEHLQTINDCVFCVHPVVISLRLKLQSLLQIKLVANSPPNGHTEANMLQKLSKAAWGKKNKYTNYS